MDSTMKRALIFALALCSLPVLIPAGVTQQMQAVLARKNAGGGGGGGDSPGTTSLVAWWDFDNTNDSHSTYNLIETGTPAYSSGVGTSSSGNYWTHPTVDNNWHTTDADCTYVVRYRGDSGAVNGQYVFAIQSNRNQIRWYETTGGTMYEISNVNIVSGDNQTEGTWYLAIVRYNSTTDDADVLVNDAAPTTSTGNGVHDYSGGDLKVPDPGGSPFSYDFLAFYNRRLTDAECTWLYNSGATRVYGDL